MSEGLLWGLAAGGALGGIATLRIAWGRPSRSLALNLAGWGLLLLAMLAGGALAGAWGIAVANLVAMALALALLAHAAARAPAAARAAMPVRRAGIAHEGEPLHLGRRTVTFLLAVPVALASAIAFAVGLRAAAIILGAGEADANALALFAVPLAWALLAYLVLVREGRAGQLATLSLCALTVVVGLIPGA